VLHRSPTRHERAALTVLIHAIAVAFAAVALAVTLLAAPAHASDADADADAEQTTDARDELTAPKAVLLGLVEGITEYLPISSTGHLHVTERLLGVGDTPETKDAADTYAITIQAGAILAVLLLLRQRFVGMVNGALGRDEAGRRVLVAVVIACVPAVLVAVAFEDAIKDDLYGAGPIVVAWFLGGIALLLLAKRLKVLGDRGRALDTITPRQALVIGAAQVIALWPGTSRSLVTIIAALLVGLGIVAAVEFSFLVGFVILLGATTYEALKNGQELLDTYGLVDPLIGFVVAFVAAAAAVTWMVRYLERHDLSIFGWYRIAIAALTLGLLATDVI
jgi:undecaprenyl-diphosphatase